VCLRVDRNDETQVVPFIVRRNFPTSGLWNRDEGHYACGFTARNENGIRMRHRDRRSFAIQPFARHNKFGFGFLTPVKSALPKNELVLIDPSALFLGVCGPFAIKLQCRPKIIAAKPKRRFGCNDGYGAGGTNGGLAARVVRHWAEVSTPRKSRTKIVNE